jgi:hypothetical protein
MPSPHSTVVVQRCCVFTIFNGAYIRLQIAEDMFPAPQQVSKAHSGDYLLPLFSSLRIGDTQEADGAVEPVPSNFGHRGTRGRPRLIADTAVQKEEKLASDALSSNSSTGTCPESEAFDHLEDDSVTGEKTEDDGTVDLVVSVTR